MPQDPSHALARENPLPDRHYPASQPVFDTGNLSVIVFVTVCTQGKKPILANPEAHASILSGWLQADSWIIGRYVVMPDHIHFFCSPRHPESPHIKRWIAYWKSCVTRTWTTPTDKPLWQRDAWDRQLRTGDSYSEKWEYVRNNPVRHGLVTDPTDWPYQGELHQFMWHDP